MVLSFGSWAPGLAAGQAAAEASHRDRFAPVAEALEKSERDLTLRLEANSRDAAALSSRGLLRLRLERSAEALNDLRAAVTNSPQDLQFHINLAYGYLMTQNFAAGAVEARAALALEDRSYAAHALLGRAQLAQGEGIQDAIAHLQKSLELNPDQVELRFELVQAFRQQKDFAGAAVQIRILKDQLPPGDARLEYAQGLLFTDTNHPQAAVRSFRRALEFKPGFLAVRQDLAAALVRMEQWQEAGDVLKPLVTARPDLYMAAYLNALALQNSHHPREAETEVRRALDLRKNSADAQTLLGIILSSQQQYEAAIGALARAAQLNPASFDAQLYLGRARYSLNDTQGAEVALENAVRLRPDDAQARFLLATIKEVSGQQQAAVEQYEAIKRIDPSDPRGYLGLGGLLGKLGRNDEALAQLRKAAELNPGDFETNMALGRLLARMGNLGESIGYLQLAARESPDSPEVHYQLALSLQRAGRKTEAAQEFSEVERLNRQRRTSSGMGVAAPKP